jgi:hypothetical protein
MQTTRLAPGDIRTLAGSWRLSLEAENKSPATLEVYGERPVCKRWSASGPRHGSERLPMGGGAPVVNETELAPRAADAPVPARPPRRVGTDPGHRDRCSGGRFDRVLEAAAPIVASFEFRTG